MRTVIPLLAVAAFAFPLSDSPEPANPDQEAAEPRVVREVVRHPARKRTIRSNFTPWPRPSVGQVHTIIDHESRKWGASSARLRHRINCESGFYWGATNGTHLGLGQYLEETFRRGMASIETRRVRRVRRRRVRLRERTTTVYSDGRRETRTTKRYRGIRRHVRRGVIPRYPPRTHGWAQLRITARAMVGRGGVGDGEWAAVCR